MPNGGVEPNTDPRFIYAEDPNVLAYRMGLVETAIEGLDRKLDKVINEYPTVSFLQLTVEPLRQDIKDLKEKREQEAADKVKSAQQMKYTTIAAVIGPLATFIITVLAGGILNGNSALG